MNIYPYPHLRILPITSADNAHNISPQFTCLNIRTSAAPHIRILPEAIWVYAKLGGVSIQKTTVRKDKMANKLHIYAVRNLLSRILKPHTMTQTNELKINS